MKKRDNDKLSQSCAACNDICSVLIERAHLLLLSLVLCIVCTRTSQQQQQLLVLDARLFHYEASALFFLKYLKVTTASRRAGGRGVRSEISFTFVSGKAADATGRGAGPQRGIKSAAAAPAGHTQTLCSSRAHGPQLTRARR